MGKIINKHILLILEEFSMVSSHSNDFKILEIHFQDKNIIFR